MGDSVADGVGVADSGVGVESSPATGVTMYAGTPSHVSSAKAHLTSNDGFYMGDDLRLELLHKNALTLTQPDPAAFPGKLIRSRRFSRRNLLIRIAFNRNNHKLTHKVQFSCSASSPGELSRTDVTTI